MAGVAGIAMVSHACPCAKKYKGLEPYLRLAQGHDKMQRVNGQMVGIVAA
jgi:hypothetical protein